MKNENFDSHQYRHCVEKARILINEKDYFSIEARDLLSQLTYDNGSINKIDFNKLTWEIILSDYSDWVEYYNLSETRFNQIKDFLIEKCNNSS